MKISMKTRYAVRFLKELSLHDPKTTKSLLSVREVAQRQGISEKFLETIAGILKHAGYITGEKGSRGGYILAKPAEEIRLGDIMRWMETDYMTAHCVEYPAEKCKNYCVEGKKCPYSKFWTEFQDALNETANRFTIQSIAVE